MNTMIYMGEINVTDDALLLPNLELVLVKRFWLLNGQSDVIVVPLSSSTTNHDICITLTTILVPPIYEFDTCTTPKQTLLPPPTEM